MSGYLFGSDAPNLMDRYHDSALEDAGCAAQWYRHQKWIGAIRPKRGQYQKIQDSLFNKWLSKGGKAKWIAQYGECVSFFRAEWETAFSNCVEGD